MKTDPEKIVFFEDESALTLEPITLTRPTWELRCGIRSIKEKILSYFPNAEANYCSRPYLAPLFSKYVDAKSPAAPETLWINGSLLPGPDFEVISELKPNRALLRNGRTIAFRGHPPLDWEAGTPIPTDGFDRVETSDNVGRLFAYIWEVILAMNAEITREAANLYTLGNLESDVHPKATLIKADKIYIAPGCRISPGVVLDATSGPIVLAEKVIIGSNAVIEGPTYLGPGAEIKPLAHLRGCSLGEQCRAGGEISVSIMQEFTNKQHGGFLGHAYLGSWCNLGSGTETSNLKNNYSSVRVQIGSRLVDTGELFVGLLMGDHAKTAIGTVFNTGTVVGVAAMIFGAGFPPRYIPSFHWGGAEKLTPYHLKPTLETARIVMSRRHRELTDADEKILTWIFNNRTC